MSAVGKYRKMPVVIEAIQWTPHENCEQVAAFIGDYFNPVDCADPLTDTYRVATLEGAVYASSGDWIIKGVQGEFYPCKPDIFAQTYEEVQE